LKLAENPLAVLSDDEPTISIDAGEELEGHLLAAAAEDDAKRKEKGDLLLWRRTGFQAIPGIGHAGFQATPWEVLHTLARAVAVSQRGAGRGLAEHWACLKYTQAIADGDGFFKLTAEGRAPTSRHYKSLQSEELGTGLALTTARRLLQAQHPGYLVSFTPADVVLRAGFALISEDGADRYNPRKGKPDVVGRRFPHHYFAELWQPGRPSLVTVISTRAHHGRSSVSHSQLLSAAVHTARLQVGPWDQLPALLVSTAFPPKSPVRVHMLQAPGNGGVLAASSCGETRLGQEARQRNLITLLEPPPEQQQRPNIEELTAGCHIYDTSREWFQQVLGRTAAAGLGAFAGHDATTHRYLLPRQRAERYAEYAHAATQSVHDASHRLQNRTFVGTDHVFRLNHTRIEAFSGIDSGLFDDLSHGRLEQYRDKVYRQRNTPRLVVWEDGDWNGPVSIDADGTVLAIHIVDVRNAPARRRPRT
jgi:hypothetical protein